LYFGFSLKITSSTLDFPLKTSAKIVFLEETAKKRMNYFISKDRTH